MTHTILADEFTIARFEAGDIEPERFTHEAHVYVAWLYVMKFPRTEALARFDAALQRFTRAIGAASKYNAMITWLFMLLIAERARQNEDWSSFRTRNADLIDERPLAAVA
jgi:hypothetical protein